MRQTRWAPFSSSIDVHKSTITSRARLQPLRGAFLIPPALLVVADLRDGGFIKKKSRLKKITLEIRFFCDMV
jgi:hypothetical protein